MPITSFQIYGYLAPSDLLHMARVCKAFACFLLHPSSATIWRDARQQESDLPDLPDDLTEHQYANLAFGLYCNVSKPFYSLSSAALRNIGLAMCAWPMLQEFMACTRPLV